VARLPRPGSDVNKWGEILNDYLGVEHNSDGTLKLDGSLAVKANDDTVVHNTDAETVAGTKTFSSSPVIPLPTLGSHAANKTYVDTTLQDGQAVADAFKVSKAGDVMTGPLLMQSSEVGGPDQSDSTSRITIQSSQTNGTNSFGEGLRMDLTGPITKNMIAWRLPWPLATGDKLIVGPSNIGFEVDTSGWSTIGGSTLVLNGQYHASGNNSAKLIFASGSAGTRGMSSLITTFIIGHTYTLNAWVYIPAGSASVVVDIDSSSVSSPSTANDMWQKLSTTWTATSTSHEIRVVNANTVASGKVVYVDEVFVTPQLSTTPKSIAWAGAHYEAQDGNSVHGHWSIEVPDAAGKLQTRFEIKFVDANNNLGVDKTIVETHNADLVLDASNGQRLRLTSSAGSEKAIEFGNNVWGNLPRWTVLQNGTVEAGGNVGSDFEIRRFNDVGVSQGTPILVTRSSGRTTIGGTDGTQSGLDVNRNAAGNAIKVTTTANNGVALAYIANDVTSKVAQVNITTDPVSRFALYADGKHEWGNGALARDANLYRLAPGQLKTDGKLVAGGGVNMGIGVTVPTTASSAGTAGDIAYDASFVYICVATNTWKRATLATW
jgi:hypothetical protein